MKFSVLALDYDGTIARHDVLEPDVRNAVAGLRAQGIVVILVTGRILADLRRGSTRARRRDVSVGSGTTLR
jgi:hydroxymethylpyrimidine pyrophosphatase-like HAD family hydrolase